MFKSYFLGHTISSYCIGKIPADEWSKIDKAKRTGVIGKIGVEDGLKHPGFTFSSDKAFELYSKFYDTIQDLNTPPRGNVSTNNSVIICGIRPGQMYDHVKRSESSWLFGPSSILLHNLLIKANVYPYFTNVYKESTNFNIAESIFLLKKELLFLNTIHTKLYNTPKLKVVCLGNYEEHAEVLKICLSLSIKFSKIWHPAFLARSYTDQKFGQWIKQFQGSIS